MNEDQVKKAEQSGRKPKVFYLAHDAYIIEDVDPCYYHYIDELSNTKEDEIKFWKMLKNHIEKTAKLYDSGCIRKSFAPLNHTKDRPFLL